MSLVCLIVAIVLFVLAAIGVSVPSVALVPAGLAFVALALAIGALPPISIRK